MSVETIKYFTAKELDALFRVIENDKRKMAVRNEALFKLTYFCALRASEVGLWKKEDLHLKSREIYCHRQKGGLNNTLRIIDDDAFRALKRYLRQDPYPDSEFLFATYCGSINRTTLHNIFRDYCQKAKIKDTSKWHMHTLRHTKAIELLEYGLDINEVQYWLGHKNISSTQIYCSFTSAQYENMYKKLRSLKRK